MDWWSSRLERPEQPCTGAGARWQAGVPSPAAAAAVRKGAVLVPVYRGGMPGAGQMGATMVNLSSGGQTRLSGAFEGVLVLLAFVLLSAGITAGILLANG